MKIKDLKGLGFELVTGNEENEINGCYIGDLLSLAMSRVEKGNAWVTIQSNINVVAVCSLTEAACVIICDGFSPDDGVVPKAEQQNITILKSELSAYEISKILASNDV